MVSTYDEIADTRPRIRRDVLYTQTPTGVHFHNARGGFSVVMPSAYRFATLIVPHLTGDHTVAALCQGLGDKQREMVVRLVGTLYARGFARAAEPAPDDTVAPSPAVAERFAEQIDYVDHYTDGAVGRFQRFRDARVAVLGDDPLARWAALSLVRNGCAAVAVPPSIDSPDNRFGEVTEEARRLREADCPVELTLLDAAPDGGAAPGTYGWEQLDGYDVVLVTGDRGPRQIAQLLAAGVPAGRLLLPAWTFGDSAVIGPLMTADSVGCWTCAVLRLGGNGRAAEAADVWSAVAPAGPRDGAARTIGGPLAAMVGNLLGYEVFRLTTGALPAETAGHLVVQDLDSLDTAAEPLLPHPRCPRCGTAAQESPAPDRPVELAALDAVSDTPAGGAALPADGPAEEDAAQAALAEITERAVLVHPNAGVFERFADENWAQTPLKVSTVTLGTGHRGRREITAYDIHHVAGARLRALLRAAEVYVEHVVPAPQPLGGAELEAAREKWRAADPAGLTIAAGLGVPAERIARWCAATSLLGGETLLVPAAAVRPFGPHNRDRVVEAT
ncbi:MAG TPA: TOMM precursor leader peptide-binding protein, partial [Streptomyces sp.]